MKYLFASSPVDEEQIRQEISSYVDDKGIDFDVMRRIQADFGVDHASVYLREALENCRKNRDFINELESSPAMDKANFEFIIIPSMFYLQHPEVGGDGTVFQLIADRLGVPFQSVKLKSLGSISENAEILKEFFEKTDQSKPKWILSMSKGTADLKRLLSLDLSDTCRKSIKGILNVSGVHGGTPLTISRKGRRLSHFLMKSWLKLRGAGRGLLAEMDREHHFSREEYKLDEHMQAVNIFGLPLLSHLRKPMLKTYAELGERGPNDGYVLTEDALIPGGNNIYFWGEDHYLRTPELNRRIEQVLRWINTQETENE